MKNYCHLTYLLLLVAVKRILVIAIGFAKSMLNSFKITASLFDHFWHYHYLRCCHSSLAFCCFPCQRWEPMVHSDLI